MKKRIPVLKNGICFVLIASSLGLATTPLTAKRALNSPRRFGVDERIAAQRAIEQVYWRHRDAAAGAKPAFAETLPEAKLHDKALEAVRMSNALETFYQEKITGGRLQAEIDRMVRATRKPVMLRELFAALGNDAHRVAESLARPLLAARLLRNAYEGTHPATQPFEAWWSAVRETMPAQLSNEPSYDYKIDNVQATACDDAWQPTAGLNERSYHTAVWTGSEMLVWGGYENKNPSTSNTGNRYDPATDTWSPIANAGAPAVRASHTAIWTGTEMIIWGGYDFVAPTFYNDGAKYNPATNTWTPVSTTNAPFARYNHTAVWTGSEMIVWGGDNAGCIGDPLHCIDFTLNAGGRYNPNTDSWTPMNTTSQPSARWLHTAVWTGSKMIVWGGSDNQFYKNDGGIYNLATDTWTPTSTTAAPQARDSHRAIWTGTEMIVWGGYAGGYLGDGSRYNPSSDTWTAISDTGAPEARVGYTMVWTGRELLVWGGTGEFIYNNGARYDVAADTWQPMSNTNAPDPRDSHTAVWTGSEMIVWGGTLVADSLNTGGRYSPLTNSWLPTSTGGAPEGRYLHTAIWTGAEMIVWGGCGPNSCGISFPNPSDPPTGSGGRYDPATDTWTPTSLINAPGGRKDFTAVWTGKEMIVWGGVASTSLNDGGRYNPATDTWAATSLVNAPAARGLFTAVWTGSEMIVWGGFVCANPPTCDQPSYNNTGGRYDPLTDTWSPTETDGAPDGRLVHVAAWTGREMIVWGGYGCPGAAQCTPDSSSDVLNTGGRYDPATHTWAATSTTNAPSPRDFLTAVWTGTEMIVWGGTVNDGVGFNTGGRYNPVTDSWSPTNTVGAPVGRTVPTSVWTGKEMIIWGGYDQSLFGINSGGRYNPQADTWTATTTSEAPNGRDSHTAVWTGSEMIVWGGRIFGVTATGGRYCAAAPPPVQLSSIVSRKTHGSAGTYDVDLTNGGSECRSGAANGDYRIVFRFANALTNVQSASVTAGTARIRSAGIAADAHEYVVDLTNVANAQTVGLGLTSVADAGGNFSTAVSASLNLLIGDTNADRFVNSADIAQTKSQSGVGLTNMNFREDLNADGAINSADIALVKSKSGSSLP